jgi:hypothetical protein
MSPDEIAEDVVKAAKAYDFAHRSAGYWVAVGDDQVRRLLAGADEYVQELVEAAHESQ